MAVKRKRKANRVDAHVGRRLRQRRVGMGMGLKALGKLAGLAHRQIQKYELGIDRIAASDLYRLARLLGVPVSYFFAGLPGGRAASERTDDESATGDRLYQRRETLDFVRAYYRIPSPKRRRRVYELIRQMAASLASGVPRQQG
jgi:transcriptional regulator with XRE-family HTH domain